MIIMNTKAINTHLMITQLALLVCIIMGGIRIWVDSRIDQQSIYNIM